MQQLSWRSILRRVEGRRIVDLWYGLDDGYLRLELHDASALLLAASWERCHVQVHENSAQHSIIESYTDEVWRRQRLR